MRCACPRLSSRAPPRSRASPGTASAPTASRAGWCNGRAIFDISADRWEDACSGLAECVALASARGQAALTAIAAFHLAIVEAALGREEDCRVHAAVAAEYALRAGNRHVATSGFPLGLLALTLGRLDEAIVEL